MVEKNWRDETHPQKVGGEKLQIFRRLFSVAPWRRKNPLLAFRAETIGGGQNPISPSPPNRAFGREPRPHRPPLMSVPGLKLF